MKRYIHVANDKAYSTTKNLAVDLLRRLWDMLSWLFLYAFYLPLAVLAEVIFLCLFLLIARYDKVTGCEDIVYFSRDLEHFGIYDLPCGGGIITNPTGAARWLRLGYGRKGASSRCILMLSKGPLTNDREKMRIGVACDVLYRLGDSIAVERLQKLRSEFLAALSSPEATSQSRKDIHTRLRYIEALIAGLCQRLGMEIPNGITPLDEEGIRYWFY